MSNYSTSALFNFSNAVASAKRSAMHLRFMGCMSQDPSLSVVIDLLEMAEKAMRAVPDIEELDARSTAEAEAAAD